MAVRLRPTGQGDDRGWHRPGFADQRWGTIAVPSSWDLDDTPGFGTLDGENFGEGTAFADGYAWYRRTFTLNTPWLDRHVRLNFLAAGYSAEVWVDGINLGKHEGASGPFSLVIPARRRTRGRHSLVVRVFRRASYPDYATGDGPISDDLEIPYKPVDYWPYAGLTRTVWLEGVNPTSITSATVVAFDLGVSRAPRWSPSRPTMITAQASLHTRGDRQHRARQVDELTATYGLRDLKVNGSALQMDGTDLFLKGMSWHEETAAHGRSMTLAEYDIELGHVTDLDANFIRNCVYTRHPYVYDWADRHGVMVMDDIDTSGSTPRRRSCRPRSTGCAARWPSPWRGISTTIRRSSCGDWRTSPRSTPTEHRSTVPGWPTSRPR